MEEGPLRKSGSHQWGPPVSLFFYNDSVARQKKKIQRKNEHREEVKDVRIGKTSQNFRIWYSA